MIKESITSKTITNYVLAFEQKSKVILESDRFDGLAIGFEEARDFSFILGSIGWLYYEGLVSLFEEREIEDLAFLMMGELCRRKFNLDIQSVQGSKELLICKSDRGILISSYDVKKLPDPVSEEDGEPKTFINQLEISHDEIYRKFILNEGGESVNCESE